MHRVLVGVDGSDESMRAVEWVAGLAKDVQGLEVTLVSVYGLEPAASAYGMALITDDFWSQWRDDIQGNL
ncbi:MAG: universal stress protein, partial [Candidatus Dormibacteraeota bacterium]|nr:universal stress protein [Candidatus Dormibacteraeota bacterium]